MAECKHPEAFVSIINDKRICGLCGAVLTEKTQKTDENVLKNVEKATPKKEGKKNARK